jgi:hypothetical protein
VAQRCLYGVDKNPFAVNLARLSLWLVTLSKHLPFTFVDHALKEGDSLVGLDMAAIEKATAEIQLGIFDGPPRSLLRDLAARREAVFSIDSRSDGDAERKQAALEEQLEASDTIRQVGDLLVAAFFQGANAKARGNLQEEKIRELNTGMSAEQIKAFRSELAAGPKGIRPFHWELEFPEVFQNGRGGFDAFVGNPPFVGGRRMKEALGQAFQDWLQSQYPESSANGDLCAFFYLRCFTLLRPDGTFGLIATNTIAQGDTRSTGLRWICTNGGTIVAARKRYRWPGVAAVVVSIVHILKGVYAGERTLDGRRVGQITAFLFDKGGHEDPKPLKANAGKSFMGSNVLGMGFTFDDSGEADDDTPGIPSPIATMESLIATNPKNAEVIFPFIGGKEVNDSPIHAHHRYVINFQDCSEEECRREQPELLAIIEKKVKPIRASLKRYAYRERWWQHAEKQSALYAAVAGCQRVFVIPCISNTLAFAALQTSLVFSHKLIVFPLQEGSSLALLQSRIHEFWARSFASTMKDDLNYSPSDCFETFSFPAALLDSFANDPTHEPQRQNLETIGDRYHQFRAELMIANNEGLTSTYNRFHDPSETNDGILKLRSLHQQMDQAVLQAYGWDDIPTSCGFGLDYLDSDDDTSLPPDLQERIASGDLFFDTASEACAFQSRLRQHGVVKPSKMLPWRHRWPDAVRDDVLARLLALNAERYSEEQARGLHGKGAKLGKSAGAAGGTRREKLNSSSIEDIKQTALAL